MKTRFIRVNDVNEIETSSISVYDLNNRYIDSRGNLYGLRYNKQKKKVEIIKIIRTPAKTAPYFQQKVLQQKYTRMREGDAARPLEDHTGAGPLSAVEAEEAAPFNPEAFTNGVLEAMKTHKNRLHGIMMNIKNSKIVPESDRMEFNTLDSFFRNLDIDGIRGIDKLLDGHRELVSYPRSISYYQSKLDAAGRKIFDSLGEDSKKMQFVYFMEIYTSVKALYMSILATLKDLSLFLEGKNIDASKSVTPSEKQNYQDAATSIENTIKEINAILKDMKRLEEFVYDAENF